MGVNVPNPSPPIPITPVPLTPTGTDHVEQVRADGREIVKQAEADNHNALATNLDRFVRAKQTQRTANTVLAREQAARARTEVKQLDQFIRPEAPVEVPHGETHLRADQFVPPPTEVHTPVPTQDPALPPQPHLSQAQPTTTAQQTNNGQPQQNSGNTGQGGQPNSGNPQTTLPQQTAVATPTPRPTVNPQQSRTAVITNAGSPDAHPEGTPTTPQTFANLMAGRPATAPRVATQPAASRVPGQPVATNTSLPTFQSGPVPGQTAQEAPARGVKLFCMGTPHPGDAPADAVHHQLEQAAIFRQCVNGGGSTTAARPPAAQPQGAVVVQAGAQQQRETSLRDIMRGRGNPNVAHNRGSRNRVTEVTPRDVALGVQRDRSSIPA